MSDTADLRAAFEAALAKAVDLDGKASALRAQYLDWEMDPHREPCGRSPQVQYDYCDSEDAARAAWSEARRLGHIYCKRTLARR